MISLENKIKNPMIKNIIILVLFSSLMILNVVIGALKINILVIIIMVVLFNTFTLALLYFGQKKYLNILQFSKIDKKLKTESVFPFIKKNFDFNSLERISILKQKSLIKKKTNGYIHKLLSIKIENQIQPLIFEIQNPLNLEKGINIIEEFIENFKHESITIYYTREFQLKSEKLKIDKSSKVETLNELNSVINDYNNELIIKREKS